MTASGSAAASRIVSAAGAGASSLADRPAPERGCPSVPGLAAQNTRPPTAPRWPRAVNHAGRNVAYPCVGDANSPPRISEHGAGRGHGYGADAGHREWIVKAGPDAATPRGWQPLGDTAHYRAAARTA
jgi:hypothetical protein